MRRTTFPPVRTTAVSSHPYHRVTNDLSFSPWHVLRARARDDIGPAVVLSLHDDVIPLLFSIHPSHLTSLDLSLSLSLRHRCRRRLFKVARAVGGRCKHARCCPFLRCTGVGMKGKGGLCHHSLELLTRRATRASWYQISASLALWHALLPLRSLSSKLISTLAGRAAYERAALIGGQNLKAQSGRATAKATEQATCLALGACLESRCYLSRLRSSLLPQLFRAILGKLP